MVFFIIICILFKVWIIVVCRVVLLISFVCRCSEVIGVCRLWLMVVSMWVWFLMKWCRCCCIRLKVVVILCVFCGLVSGSGVIFLLWFICFVVWVSVLIGCRMWCRNKVMISNIGRVFIGIENCSGWIQFCVIKGCCCVLIYRFVGVCSVMCSRVGLLLVLCRLMCNVLGGRFSCVCSCWCSRFWLLFFLWVVLICGFGLSWQCVLLLLVCVSVFCVCVVGSCVRCQVMVVCLVIWLCEMMWMCVLFGCISSSLIRCVVIRFSSSRVSNCVVMLCGQVFMVWLGWYLCVWLVGSCCFRLF